MKNLPAFLTVSALVPAFLLAGLATAAEYGAIDVSRYSDGPWNTETNAAVSVLSDEGVILGNPDGTFAANRTLNRAEFMTIVMRLMPDADAAVQTSVDLSCFPDVASNAWYALAVCRAKASGIVRGNVREGVPADEWRFEPARDVQYEEAVKVLALLFALPADTSSDGLWYLPFIEAAADAGVSLEGLLPGERITRGEMARLTAQFWAQSRGELDLLRAAMRGETVSSRSSQSSQSVSSAGSSRLSSSSVHSGSAGSATSSSSVSSQTSVQNAIRSDILLLGEDSPYLAGVRFFSNNEPVMVTMLSVELVNSVQSVDAFLLYDTDLTLLGTATLRSDGFYRLSLSGDDLLLPRRENVSVYARARLKGENEGGVSGEELQVNRILLSGTGDWSSDTYNTQSDVSFPAYQTARSRLSTVERTGAADMVLTSGTEVLLAEFLFTAEGNAGADDTRVTDLTFTQNGSAVTLSNVEIATPGSDLRSGCTVASGTVTCDSVPAEIGTVPEGTAGKTIRVYGDLVVDGGASSPSFSLSLNRPGTSGEAGDITWTDGETTFTWVPFDQPVATGTLHD